MFKALQLPGGFAPLAPYHGFALDPLGALSGPQTPRPIILHPPFLIPGYGPGNIKGGRVYFIFNLVAPSARSRSHWNCSDYPLFAFPIKITQKLLLPSFHFEGFCVIFLLSPYNNIPMGHIAYLRNQII